MSYLDPHGTLCEPQRTRVTDRTNLLLDKVHDVLVEQIGPRETYELLQRAADAVAEMITQPEKRHV